VEIWPFEIIQDGGIEIVRIENSAKHEVDLTTGCGDMAI